MGLGLLLEYINQGFCSATQDISASEGIIQSQAKIAFVDNCTN